MERYLKKDECQVMCVLGVGLELRVQEFRLGFRLELG